MIRIERITTKDSKLYKKMQTLMTSTFPEKERRDIEEQRIYTDNKDNFKCNIILDNETFIGFVNYWEFENAFYIEHFAVVKELRSKGYGKKILNEIIKQLKQKIIILEVEPPLDLISIKRIEFYLKNGFILSQTKYMQPSYREGGSEFELKLMHYGDSHYYDRNITSIIRDIHNYVYGKHI